MHQLSPLQDKLARNVRPHGIFLIEEENLSFVYGSDAIETVQELLDIEIVAVNQKNVLDHVDLLEKADIAMAGWGTPLLDEAFLKRAPHLKALFYAAGSVRSFVTPGVWDRKIVVSSAYAVNALPVAEFSLGVTLLSLKHFWRLSREAKAGEPWGDHRRNVPGGYKSTVGLISAGRIARHLLELLKSFEMNRIIYCPMLSQQAARDLGAELHTLPYVFSESDVVSIHTPLLESTRSMIGMDLLSRMKKGATLLNTSRGGVINEAELVEFLQIRPDVTAILDVVVQEPPARDSLLLQLPNVVLTPHIAGSQGDECLRLGDAMVNELKRYLNNEPLNWEITRETAQHLA